MSGVPVQGMTPGDEEVEIVSATRLGSCLVSLGAVPRYTKRAALLLSAAQPPRLTLTLLVPAGLGPRGGSQTELVDLEKLAHAAKIGGAAEARALAHGYGLVPPAWDVVSIDVREDVIDGYHIHAECLLTPTLAMVFAGGLAAAAEQPSLAAPG